MSLRKKIDVTIVGGGMITNDQILPSIYHLQRIGIVGEIKICALNSGPLKFLSESKEFSQAFPGQKFTAFPPLSEPSEKVFPNLFHEVIKSMPPYNCVFIALPDQMHYDAVKKALECNQNIISVKPLVLKYQQTVEIERLAYSKGLFVGIEYHKRFDRRSLLAKKIYEQGKYGEFIMGEAKLIEPYYYRNSNFQNWFTYDKTDPFTYVGCHYWDLIQFITGLKPIEVSVKGIKRKFPNGNLGFLWSHGRIVYENGAILSLINGLGYPDLGAGSNMQGLEMYFEGNGKTGHLKHNDQMRGVEYSYLEPLDENSANFKYVNPDYFKLVPWEGAGYKPVGYGYESIEANIMTISNIENSVSGLEGNAAIGNRQILLREIDRKGIIATPANSWTNELITEAGRLSIINEGQPVNIIYSDTPRVELKK